MASQSQSQSLTAPDNGDRLDPTTGGESDGGSDRTATTATRAVTEVYVVDVDGVTDQGFTDTYHEDLDFMDMCVEEAVEQSRAERKKKSKSRSGSGSESGSKKKKDTVDKGKGKGNGKDKSEGKRKGSDPSAYGEARRGSNPLSLFSRRSSVSDRGRNDRTSMDLSSSAEMTNVTTVASAHTVIEEADEDDYTFSGALESFSFDTPEPESSKRNQKGKEKEKNRPKRQNSIVSRGGKDGRESDTTGSTPMPMFSRRGSYASIWSRSSKESGSKADKEDGAAKGQYEVMCSPVVALQSPG
jgi:hypothetical protein